MDPAHFAPVVASLERGRIVHYLHVSAAALFVYDYFTTLADEVAFIWRAHWGAGKILFLVVRYITWPELFIVLYIELFDVPNHVCHAIYTYTTWSIVAGITIAEMVMILRTWAIWDGRRTVLLALSTILFAITISNCVVVVYYVSHTRVIRAAEVLPGIIGCVLVSSTKRVGVAWMSIAAFELVIVAMTLVKGIQHFRTSSSTLLSSLYRDGLLYFIYLFAISLANMIFVYSAPDEYIVLLAEMQRAFHAILSCRIILHLRAAATRHASYRDTMLDTITASASVWFGHSRVGAQLPDWKD